MWSSSDGKGRTKYPMIVCVQVRGVPLPTALDRVLPELEAVQRSCEATTSADDVRSILAAARDRLRASLAAPPGEPEVVVPADAIKRLADEPEFAGSGEGLLRVLYQVEREMSGFLSIGPGGKSRIGTVPAGSKTRIGDLRPQQIRVPACGREPGEVALRWIRFLLAMLDPVAPMVVIVPIGEAWADLIVGEPVGSQFFCIRATPKSIPLTSDIPYTLDPAFVASARRLLESPLDDGDIVVRRPSGHMAAPLGNVAAKLGWSRQAKLLGLGIGAAVLLGVLAVTLRPSSQQGSPAETRTPVRRTERPAHAARPPSPSQGTTAGTAAPAAPGEGEFDDRPWRALCEEYQQWAGQLLRKLDESRRARYAADPGLAPVLACFGDAREPADPWSIAGVARGPISHLVRNPPDAVRSAEGVRRTAQALERVLAAKRALSPDGWRRLADLQLAGHAFRERGWIAAHEQVTAAVKGVSPEAGADVAAAIDTVLALGDVVESVQRRWGAIEAIAQTLSETGDPVLAAYRGWAAGLGAAARVGGAGGAEDPASLLREIDRRLAEAQSLGEELAAFVRSGGWASLDHAAFQRGSRSHQSLASGRSPDAAMFRNWLFEAPSYPAPDMSADPRRGWQELGGTRGPEELAAATRGVEELRAYLARRGASVQEQDEEIFALLDELRARAAELSARRWSAAERGEIEAQAARLTDRAAELTRAVNRRIAHLRNQFEQSFADTVARLRRRDEITSSAALNEAWRTLRDALIDEQTAASGSGGGGDAAVLVERATALEESIDALDRAAPMPELPAGAAAAPWGSAIKAEMARQRESVLTDAAARLVQGADADDVARGLASSHRVAQERLVALASDAAALEGMLGAGCGLRERAPAGEGPTVADVAARMESSLAHASDGLRTALAPLRDRVGRLRSIGESSDRADLAAMVRGARADAPEQALAAWRRLGEIGWPAGLDELEQELALRESVERVVGAVRDPDRRDALAAELAAEAAVRFERGAAAIGDVAQMDAALAMLEPLSLTSDDLRNPALRLNALIRGLRRDLSRQGIDEAGAREVVSAFVTRAARDAAAVLSADEGAARLVARLEEALAAADAPPQQPQVDFSTLGPGATGNAWRVEVIDGGAELVYRRSVDRGGRNGGGSELELRFVRVATSDGAGAYLLANELSLGQFLGIMRTAGDWEDFSTLVLTFIGSTDPRRGPRVWEWEENSRGLVLAVRPATAWLREVRTMESTPAYLAGLNPGVPTLDHPLQQIPPDAAVYVAALVGCRLPTSAEWLAAYEAEGRAVPMDRRNLRDAAWKRQQAYVEEVRRSGKLPQWPDDGIFWPAGSRSERRGLTAESHPWDDGTLWFEPAIAPTGVNHLVGNVAEYVFEDPSVFAGLASPEPAAIRDLLEANASKLRVIGGSALSAPEIPVDEPQALDLDAAIDLGFADVGVRIAFSVDGNAGAPVGVLGTARALLRSPPYVLNR